MRDLIEEQLVHLRGMRYFSADAFERASDASSGADEEFNLAEWAADGGNFEVLLFSDSDHVDREACAYAWGYLRGVAEMADLTLDQLLDEYDLAWNKPAKPLSRTRRTRRAS
ncbi:MAG TPA: hypothetical protein VFD36_29365 [Kofleriaceae bacterium]|nr:hypothetical protein [Kofleriaceae bacterium]